MYILGWRIGIDPPTEFMHSFFHSSTAQYGNNYVGYQNASCDELIDLARSTDNESIRKECIMEAQASIAYDLPYDVLYYKTNIDAISLRHFRGWIPIKELTHYGFLSRETVINLRGPYPYQLNAKFNELPSAMSSNSSMTVSFLVTDQDRVPVSNAHIILNASHGSLAAEEGFTDSSGKFSTTFTAPYVATTQDTFNNGSNVIIQIISATYESPDYEDYEPAPSRLTLIRVYPEDVQFLAVALSADPDVINPDITSDGNILGFTYVDVQVDDQNGDSVEGAGVSLYITPKGPSVEPQNQNTDEDGIARFTITAIDEPNDDGSIVQYRIFAYAELASDTEMKPGNNSMVIDIVDSFIPEAPPPEINNWNQFQFLAFGFVIFAIYMGLIMAYYKNKS